jgi:hypothetical protein
MADKLCGLGLCQAALLAQNADGFLQVGGASDNHNDTDQFYNAKNKYM